jgi:hypothetical protein
MDLVRPWLAALAVLLTASLGTAYLISNVTTPERLASTSGTVVWNAAPSLVIYLLAVLFAAIVHPVTHRENPRRHLLAVFGVPAAAILFSAAYALFTGAVLASAVSILGGLAGAAGGWTLTARLRTGKDQTSDSGGYF